MDTGAVVTAQTVAESLGLAADEAIVLQNSNKLTLRLLPSDVVARVAPSAHQNVRFEVDLAQRLAGGPVAALDPRVEPRVHSRDDLRITFWTFYEGSAEISPADYASALARLHARMREVDLPTPHFTDRVTEAEELAADRDRTPDLADDDREVLARTLRTHRRSILERGAPEQLLHGEPHPGNLVAGPRFIDLETCCRGPVEYDLAHAPEEVAAHYPGLDHDLLRDCRLLVLATITMWRWDRDDQLPGGRALAAEWLDQIRRRSS
ncbi:phosphotransferase [Actinoplanes sp. NPDC049265]|uniref:phosphotransferase n=1 Tax=Actinoplanes sp. NPDC049265 TaxID=3363902 RepID=UPI003711CF58